MAWPRWGCGSGAARRGADGSARSRRGAGESRVRERDRARVRTAGRGPGCCVGAGEAVSAVEKSRPALCVATPIYGEVGAAMTGHFKINGVGTLWLPGNDEVMTKEVGAVMIVWELWRGTVTREPSMETR